MKTPYPLACPAFIIEHINEQLADGVNTVDMYIPTMARDIHRLNKERLAYPPKSMKDDEGFAAWVFNFGEDGRFYVTADQPHYLKKGAPRTYVWDENVKGFKPSRTVRFRP